MQVYIENDPTAAEMEIRNETKWTALTRDNRKKNENLL